MSTQVHGTQATARDCRRESGAHCDVCVAAIPPGTRSAYVNWRAAARNARQWSQCAGSAVATPRDHAMRPTRPTLHGPRTRRHTARCAPLGAAVRYSAAPAVRSVRPRFRTARPRGTPTGVAVRRLLRGSDRTRQHAGRARHDAWRPRLPRGQRRGVPPVLGRDPARQKSADTRRMAADASHAGRSVRRHQPPTGAASARSTARRLLRASASMATTAASARRQSHTARRRVTPGGIATAGRAWTPA